MIYMIAFSWYEQISAWLKMFHDIFHVPYILESNLHPNLIRTQFLAIS